MKHSAVRTSLRRPALFVALVGGMGLGLASQAARAAEYATVVSSTPVNVPMTVAQRVCNTERQVVPAQQTGAGAVIGAVIGGLAGNAIGGGTGRALATGAGVMAGAVVGNQVEANAAANAGTEVPVQRCQVVNTTQQRTVGYDVMYDYHGQRYSTRMSYDPGPRVEIDVKPRDAGAPSPVADSGPVPPAHAAAQAPVTTVYPSAPVYQPVPVYAPAPVVYPYPYVYPSISFGIGYYGGYHRHWR